jgi:hypothetical protein
VIHVDKHLREQATRARRGYLLCQEDVSKRQRAIDWIQQHPSAMADVDALWLEALHSQGKLTSWLLSDLDIYDWQDPQLPMRCILAGHPFRDLPLWTLTQN